MDDEIGFLEGPFDSDETADAVAEIEESDDVAAAMTGLLGEFLRFHEEDDDLAEAALAVACLVAARMSGIAPDERAHHWLDRNPFAVTEDLRRLAAAAFACTTGPDGLLAHLRPDWQDFLDHVEPYRKALAGEPQEVWIDFGHPHLLPGEDVEREVAADLHRALSAAGRYLGLASLPPLPA
ncbi:DUF4259 domain-containing protein [Microbispora sp. NBC_01389]|uniref:DUF4259 domain-containing protein n=1 Tax=Microbispora sp. NBC_01389 TaxID=2903584 RepID=UPI00325597C7